MQVLLHKLSHHHHHPIKTNNSHLIISFSTKHKNSSYLNASYISISAFETRILRNMNEYMTIDNIIKILRLGYYLCRLLLVPLWFYHVYYPVKNSTVFQITLWHNLKSTDSFCSIVAKGSKGRQHHQRENLDK